MVGFRFVVSLLALILLSGGEVRAQVTPAVPATAASAARSPALASTNGSPPADRASAQAGVPATLTITQSSGREPEKDDAASSIAAIISALGAFAWPVAVLTGIYLARDNLVKLVSNVAKLKYGDFSIDFQAQRANEAMVKVSEDRPVTPEDIEAIFDAVRSNEWATLIMARMLMRRGLAAIVGPDVGDDPSLMKMLPKANGILGDRLERDLDRLRVVSYYAEWWKKAPPSIRDWHWAVENARRLTVELFARIPSP